MPYRPVTISQKELTGYAKAMNDAGVAVWSVVAEKPDGTRLIITAGDKQEAGKNEIDKMLGLD